MPINILKKKIICQSNLKLAVELVKYVTALVVL